MCRRQILSRVQAAPCPGVWTDCHVPRAAPNASRPSLTNQWLSIRCYNHLCIVIVRLDCTLVLPPSPSNMGCAALSSRGWLTYRGMAALSNAITCGPHYDSLFSPRKLRTAVRCAGVYGVRISIALCCLTSSEAQIRRCLEHDTKGSNNNYWA